MKSPCYMTMSELEKELDGWRGNRASLAITRSKELHDELKRRNIKPDDRAAKIKDVAARMRQAIQRDPKGHPGFTRDPDKEDDE